LRKKHKSQTKVAFSVAVKYDFLKINGRNGSTAYSRIFGWVSV
jgi:hypothetical protein